MNLQRIVKGKTVKQAAFSYAYNTKLSEIVFNYNSDLVKKVQQFLTQVVKNTATDFKGKGPVKIYRVPKPGFGKKKSSPPFLVEKSLHPPNFFFEINTSPPFLLFPKIEHCHWLQR